MQGEELNPLSARYNICLTHQNLGDVAQRPGGVKNTNSRGGHPVDGGTVFIMAHIAITIDVGEGVAKSPLITCDVAYLTLDTYLEDVGKSCEFEHWYFGSLHLDKVISKTHISLFTGIFNAVTGEEVK